MSPALRKLKLWCGAQQPAKIPPLPQDNAVLLAELANVVQQANVNLPKKPSTLVVQPRLTTRVRHLEHWDHSSSPVLRLRNRTRSAGHLHQCNRNRRFLWILQRLSPCKAKASTRSKNEARYPLTSSAQGRTPLIRPANVSQYRNP